jgi:cytochrome c-type biogenesis protein CcmF
MTLAHIGIGVFALGASFETAWRADGAEALRLGQSMHVAGYTLRLDQVGQEFGPNYVGERALIRVTRADGRLLCVAAPDRKLYAARAQTISGVAICPTALDDLYVVAGDKRVGADGAPAWLIRTYWNPWVRFIFAGPLLMALGGLVSLSDRRLRFAVTRRSRARTASASGPAPESATEPAPAPGPAE